MFLLLPQASSELNTTKKQDNNIILDNVDYNALLFLFMESQLT